MPSKKKYNLVAENTQSTVVAEYTPDGIRVAHYQSEADLERAFIEQLKTQAYEYITIASEADLVIGSRFLDKQSNIPKYRKLGITVLNKATNIGARREISDSQSGFPGTERPARTPRERRQ